MDDNVDLTLVRDALAGISPDDRDTWIKVGMAMVDGGLPEDMWHEWSSRSDKYDRADACKVWKSFTRGGGVGIGTLFMIAKQAGWTMPTKHRHEKPTMAEEPDVVPNIEAEPINPKLLSWMAQRGVGEDVVRRAGVRIVKRFIPAEKSEVWAMAFPYVRDGQVVNHKFRSHKKNFAMVKGCPRPLYNVDALASDVSIVVEGEMDALSLMEVGFDAVVSVPNGAQSPDCLVECEAEVEAVSKWVLAVDNDGPGIKLERELSRRLGRERCMRVTWPDGCKDANETLVKKGPQVLRETILDAQWYPIGGILEGAEVDVEAMRFHAEGFRPGLELGWDVLDKHYTVQPGELTIVTGIPGHGKSTWLDNVATRMAKRYDWKIAFFSPENAPAGRHKAMLVEKWADAPVRGSYGRDGMGASDFAAMLMKMRDRFFWVDPAEDSACTVDGILEAAKALVFRQGINGFVIDPWNELELPDNERETVAIGKALRRIRRFARSHDVHVWIVAHPQKLYRQDGVYPIPSLYDINGSANFRNRCDMGLVVWRDTENDAEPVKVDVQKVRFRHNGKLGMVELRYDPVCATYHDIKPADNQAEWTDAGDGYA